MNFHEALSYLLSLGHETLTIKLGLRKTEQLLDALGNPQRDFPAVQIAGTNGKGSTAVMLDSICRAAEIRTGLFTSPHLVSITERIKIGGAEISEDAFARLTEQVKLSAAELMRQGLLQTLPTFFEHVTAIALVAFREAKVELAILETGLGGRLASTTAAGARIVAITPIAMDHEEYLGQSLAEIAAEKAAIIRPGVTAVVAPQDQVALDTILRRCETAGVAPRMIDLHETVTVTAGCKTYRNIRPGLRGRHQVTNASVAIALAEALRQEGFHISPAAVITGIENARHPGRLELWSGEPPILFDGAHNPAAARALSNYIAEFVKAPITMIFGAMRDKDLNQMAALLFPCADKLILVQLDNPRAAVLEELTQSVPENIERAGIKLATSVTDALDMAAQQTPGDGVICITGSLYLVGAAQELVRARNLSVKLVSSF